MLSVRDAKASKTGITPGLGGLGGMGTQTTGRAIRKQGDKRTQLCDEGSVVARGALDPHSDTKQASWCKRPLGGDLIYKKESVR